MSSERAQAAIEFRAAHARRRRRRHRRARHRAARRPRRDLRRRDRPDPRRARPRDRHRHGQIRPCRAQDRLDLRLHRHAGAVRASGRSEPRRSRHDRQQRRHHRAVVVGRDGGAQESHRLFAPLPHRPDRDDRQRGLDAGQDRRRGAGAAAGARGLPAQSGADHLLADAARARRRARHRAAGKPRLHGGRFRPAASGRQARHAAQDGARLHAHGRRRCRSRRSARACRTRSSRCRPRASAASASPMRAASWSASSPTATCAATCATTCSTRASTT